MGKNQINRIGERNINNFGSEMIIVEYRGCMDIDVYFPQYDWIARNKQYYNFKRGQISCSYEKTIYGIGYIGEGKYKASENGKHTRVYDTWNDMLRRCYSKECHKKYPTYVNCETSKEFHNFQNFGDWDKDNFYQVEGERMCLDKDILVKHNKIYSSDTCIYTPQTINNLFTKCDKSRGESAIGTCLENGKYRAYCNLINPKTGKSKFKHFGYYDTELEAFEIYKYYKEKNIKQVADYYLGEIPERLYDALCRYEVEITD